MGDSQANCKRKDYKTWTIAESNFLLELMVEGAKFGWRDINGVISKHSVETRLLPKLKEKLGYEITYNQYQSRVKWFKKQYSNYSQLMRHNSGFGWDPITKKFTASEEVWSDYLKSNTLHGNLRSDAFPDYDDLRIAVGNGTATGLGSIGLGEATDATILGAQEDDIDGIEGLSFDPDTNTFVQSENMSSPQNTSPFFSRHSDQPTNAGNPSSSNKAHGKRSRAEFESNNNVKGANGQDAVLENLSSGFGKIVQSFDKICYLMEKREARGNDIFDAMKETPGLRDEDCFKALDLLNTKAKQEFFLRMTPEQRYHWIINL